MEHVRGQTTETWRNHNRRGGSWLFGHMLLGHSIHHRELTIKFSTESKIGFVFCGHGTGRMMASSVWD